MPPLLSVLIAAYNGELHLRLTLASILEQSYPNFELLITDDGSQDATWPILTEAAAADQRVQLFRNEHNLGVPLTMNHLFGLASGLFVNRHDADDVSLPERFAKQVAYLQDNPLVGVVGSRAQLIDPAGKLLDVDYFPSKLSNAEIQEELLHGNCLCQGSVMFRRELLDKVGVYDERNVGSEDYDLWLRLAEVTQISVLDEILYQYRLHPDSLSHRRRHEQAFHGARALDEAVRRRFGPSAPPERREAVAQYYLQAAFFAYRVGDITATRDYVRHAAQVYPRVFENEIALTKLLLPQFTATGTTDEALRLVHAMFADCLPPSRALGRLKSRWLAEIHMRAVFRDRRQMEEKVWRRHLWLGIRHRPAWLLNRGVLALLLK